MFQLTITKINEVLFEGQAESLTVPATDGEMTVLHAHMPLITTLKEGNAVVRVKGEPERRIPIGGGILEVNRDGATVIL